MFRKITLSAVLLAFIVVVLGATLRLSGVEILSADKDLYENLLAEPHFYPAVGLAVLVLVLNFLAWREQHCRLTAISISLNLLILLGLQGYIGIAIVLNEQLPVLAAGHLLLGMITLWSLFWLYLRANPLIVRQQSGSSLLAGFAILLLFVQISLGAWVSDNHAGLACADFSDFLSCTEQLTITDYINAFNPDGVSTLPAQIALIGSHLILAIVSFLVLLIVVIRAKSNQQSKIRWSGLILGVLLLIELGLGIVSSQLWSSGFIAFGDELDSLQVIIDIKQLYNVLAIAHHAVAALMMLTLITIFFYSRYGFVSIPEPETKTVTPVSEEKPKPVEDHPKTIIDEQPTFVEKPIEAHYVEPEPESLYARLKAQLQRTRSGLSGILANLPIGKGQSDDLLEEIEANLLMADLGVDATTAIINRLTQRLEKHQLTDSETLLATLKQELLSILKPCSQPLQIPKQDKPFVILVVGVNGAGKTTTIGKLANRLQAQGHSVMLAAGDTFRAAAVEQLQVWGERNHIPVVAQHTGADSASVIYDAVQSAQAKSIDVLIADTAGRLQTKSNLMDELKKIKRIMGKLDESAPHEVLLVLDAGTGQNALSQAKLFNEAVTLTGLVLTKLDGTAKGGVIFALAKHSCIPIRFIGIGEGIDDLQDFNAELFVDALFVKD
jgi:fused signal recognition particle receptor